MQATNALTADLIDRNQRSSILRRRFLAGLLVVFLIVSFLVWKIARHFLAIGWLEANQFVVVYSLENGNWRLGGTTSVRYSTSSNYFTSERPVFDLRFLKDLHRLEELDLATLMEISDASLHNLGELTSLRKLNLDRSHHPDWKKDTETRLTDLTLARIGQLYRLEELNLGGQSITDAGLGSLKELDQLRSLDLEGTPITDAGLLHLKSLPSLKTLDLSGTRVTAQGVADFQEARPLVKVIDNADSLIPMPKNP